MAVSEQYLQAEMACIHASGLFLEDWYVARHPELARPGVNPLAYFCAMGWRQGDLPNPYFDPAYYLAANQDVARAGLNPLLHYITHGDKEGRDPCGFFQVAWYREQYQVAASQTALGHFLERRFSGQVAPVPLFDPVFYLETNPDVAAVGADPFEHFLAFGQAEGRNPCAGFDVVFYAARYGAVLGGLNPLLHYLANRAGGMFFAARPDHEKLIPGAVKHATRAGPLFEEVYPVAPTAPRRAKLLAFYLPQFHAVAENDAWWGKGFTDWTNLARALPRFAGHLQPRIPRDLGFYSLRDADVLRRQVALAKGGGLFGFVFYFYWFNGKRLLETPLNLLLENKDIEFPFCVTWANENWTRRWDGLAHDVLMVQQYREQDDAALVACFAALFADARYIRIGGRPLLMIYRAGLVPDAASRIAAWRALFEAGHGENPLIVMVQSLEDHSPLPYGLDGAVEFPPHKIADALAGMNAGLDLFDPEFSAKVYDYQDVAAASVAVGVPEFPLIKTIVPGWDNDPRREGKGLVLHHSSPARYQAWLEKLVDYANAYPFHGENFVCVNGWNEWAEGAFLEPDVHFGAAYLNATGRALCAATPPGKARLLLVGHDAHRHGAQMLLLHLARHYGSVCGMEVHLLLLGAGPLVQDYEQVARVTLTNDKETIARQLAFYARLGIRHAIVNSAASARMVPELAAQGIEATLLVHEMPGLLAAYNLQMQAKLGAMAAKCVVFAGEFPRQRFCEALGIELEGAVILPQGNYQNVQASAQSRLDTRAALNMPPQAFLVVGAGYGDFRKGFDLFLQVARYVMALRDDAWFVWVGDVQPELKAYLGDEIAAARETGRFVLAGYTDQVGRYFSAGDVFALTSREDVYPTVVLEAMACGMPVVAFNKAGAVPDLLRDHEAGLVAAHGDVNDFKACLLALFDHEALELRKPALVALARARGSHAGYAQRLLAACWPGWQRVSVCVLNYNYARYLKPRLDSVFGQTYPVAEVLFVDDGSQDGSNEVAAAQARTQGRELTIIANLKNAGSVFKQWLHAVEAASGDFIWIAEADDVCAPQLLSRLMEMMAADESVLLGFTDSQMIDEEGRITAPDYQYHYREAGADMLMQTGVWPARDFAAHCLAVQNLIYNVSAVVWRRDALLAALRRCGEEWEPWRVAGDWRLYWEVMGGADGKIAFVAEALNSHRRHATSHVQNFNFKAHVDEVKRMQEWVADRVDIGMAGKKAQKLYLKKLQKMLKV